MITRQTTRRLRMAIGLLLFPVMAASAQKFDILIKNGHVMDVKNNIDRVMDIAVQHGKIAKVATNIPENQGNIVVDADGLYVTPGLIDLHGHHFAGTDPHGRMNNGFAALAPDGFSFESGVTTIVDAGSTGWRDFRTFKEQTIDRSKTRILSFLNIVGSGMKDVVVEQNLNDIDPLLTAMTVGQFPDLIVGIKLAHYNQSNWIATERAVEAGTQADIPVMIDFGRTHPELSLKTLLLEKLRPGDIFTHTYANIEGRIPIVNAEGKVRDYVFAAQERGIIFDVGHGGGSFVYDQAVPALRQGLKPNSISTDLHIGSMNEGMKDILNVMSKFLNLDVSLKDVVTAVTWNPAQIIKRPDLGHLSVGAVADVTILNLREGDFGFIDTANKKMRGGLKLECELTMREGDVVYDLNGLSKPLWTGN